MLQELIRGRNVYILLSVHDPYSANYCERILFINDGKLYRQVYRHHMREEFYQEILYILVDFDR